MLESQLMVLRMLYDLLLDDEVKSDLQVECSNESSKVEKLARNRRFKRKSASVPSLATININNLLNAVLSSKETMLLLKGLNYCIAPKTFNSFQLAVDDVIRSYRLKEYFFSCLSASIGHHGKSQNTEDTKLDYNVIKLPHILRLKCSWTPPLSRNQDLDHFLNSIKKEILKPRH